MSTPPLTIIIPNYNDSATLGRGLDAICQQSWLPLEVIVVDDGSTDKSVELVLQYAARYPFVRLHQNEINRGANYSANLGLSLAKGTYVTCISANDLMLPGCIEKSMRLLAQFPQAGMCSGPSLMVHSVSGEIIPDRNILGSQERYFSPLELTQFKKNSGFGYVCVYRKDALLEAGGFLPQLQWFSNVFADLVIAFRYGLCYIPEPVYKMWLHPQSYFGSATSDPANVNRRREVILNVVRLLYAPQYANVNKLCKQIDWFAGFGDLSGRFLLSLLLADPRHWQLFAPRVLNKVSERLRRLLSVSRMSPGAG